MPRTILESHVTSGLAATRAGLPRQWVTKLCELGRAPGALWVSDGHRGIWLVKLDETGEPMLDRKPRWKSSNPTT